MVIARFSEIMATFIFTIVAATSPDDFLFPASLEPALSKLFQTFEVLVPELDVQVKDPSLVALQGDRGVHRVADALLLNPSGAARAEGIRKILKKQVRIKKEISEGISFWATCGAVRGKLAVGAECEGTIKACSRVSRRGFVFRSQAAFQL